MHSIKLLMNNINKRRLYCLKYGESSKYEPTYEIFTKNVA